MTPKAAPAADMIRETILAEFSERATRHGIKSVVMAELAAELGISTRTLYSHFRTKEELVNELIDSWTADSVAQAVALAPRHGLRPIDALKRWAAEWADTLGRFTPVFWQDLKRDYPAAYRRHLQNMQSKRAGRAELLGPLLRKGIPLEAAMTTFEAILTNAIRPEVCERLDMTRKQSVLAAIDIWAQGAFNDTAKFEVEK